MPTHKTAKELARQVGDLLGDVVTFITKLFFSLNEQQLRWLGSHKRQLFNALRSAILNLAGDVRNKELLSDWERFYKEVWGEKAVDLSNLVFPPARDDFDCFVVMLEGMTFNRILIKTKERFRSWWFGEKFDNITSPRTADKTYIVRCRDRVEADEEHKNKSANDCKAQGLNIMTVEERMMLELFFHWKTDGHLDINTLTLTSSHNIHDGSVVGIGWDVINNELDIGSCYSGDHYDDWCSREVVS